MEGYVLINPLVSIIMPVYNVEKYIEQAINSILNQSYKNFELILVDDASPDNSPAICDHFAQTDDRIRVIHKNINQGVGFARNTGLESADGDYIFFIDPDDYLDPGLLEKVFNGLRPETEIFVFGVNRFYENKKGKVTKTEKLSPSMTSTKGRNDIASVFISLNKLKIFPFVWNKIYKKSFLRSTGVVFEKTNITEDFLFNINVFSKAQYIDVIPDTLYFYRKPKHETLASAYNPDFFNLSKRKYILEKNFLATLNADTVENCQLIYAAYIRHIVSVFLKNKLKKANLSKKEQLQEITLVLNDEITIDVLNKYIPSGPIMKVLVRLLKSKNAVLCYIFTYIADFIF